MTTRTYFDMSGFDAQLELIASLGDGVDEAADAALLAGAEVALDGQQARVPVDTGNLRSEIKIGELQTDGNYHSIAVGLIDTDAETAKYGMVQEYGSSSVEAQSYIRRSADEDKGKVRAAQRAVLNGFIASRGGGA